MSSKFKLGFPMITNKTFRTYQFLFFLYALFCVHHCFAKDRKSSFPYISGDTFREFCDYIVDEDCKTLIPEKVQCGQTIFLKTDFLPSFFENLHPQIANPYILITHNSDHPAPGDFVKYLEDPKLIAWFAQNMSEFHPKLHPLPIGIANRCWSHGSVEILEQVLAKFHKLPRTLLLYMNFQKATYLSERSFVYNLFKNQPFVTKKNATSFRRFLVDLAISKFVLSPRGNGLDCHRTWESLLMGAIPIVKSSTLDSLFEGLPVLIVKEWNEITQNFLEKKWLEMNVIEYQMEKLYAGYWFQMVTSI